MFVVCGLKSSILYSFSPTWPLKLKTYFLNSLVKFLSGDTVPSAIFNSVSAETPNTLKLFNICSLLIGPFKSSPFVVNSILNGLESM